MTHPLPDDHKIADVADLVLFLGGSLDSNSSSSRASGTSFTGMLLGLIVKADPDNLERLRAVYPRAVRAWEIWRTQAPYITAAMLDMQLSSMPPGVLRTWPDVSAQAWRRVAPQRFRADLPDRTVLVVVEPDDQHPIGQVISPHAAADPLRVGEAYAQLFRDKGAIAGYRWACRNGTPVVLQDAPDHCRWCGVRPEDHQGYPTLDRDHAT